VPGQRFNLFSTTTLQLDGWIPGVDTEALWFTRPNTNLWLKLNAGAFSQHVFVVLPNNRRSLRMDILQAHRRLGHMSEDITRKTAKELGWVIEPGSRQTCEAYACWTGKNCID
jgi:hypothetical protein